MKIAILIPSISDYIRGEDGSPLNFDSIRDMLLYLKNHNISITESLEFVYEVEV